LYIQNSKAFTKNPPRTKKGVHQVHRIQDIYTKLIVFTYISNDPVDTEIKITILSPKKPKYMIN